MPETTPDLDAASAAIIAAGMKAVAKADGDVHHRELELIETFEAEVKGAAPSDAASVLRSPDVRDVYLRSLLMVALADGTISPEEERVIRGLAGDLGFEEGQIDDVTRSVKMEFLAQFANVTVFRESVERIAEDLGLDADAVTHLHQD